MLEQISLLNIQVCQVAETIRILEHLATFYSLIDGCAQELEFLDRILFQIVKHFDFIVDYGTKLTSKLLRLIMVIVALEVEYVLL